MWLVFAFCVLAATSHTSVADAAPRTIRIEIQGAGRVTGPGIDCSATCSVSADSGRPLNAHEQPGSGYVFESWTGCRAGTGGSNPYCFVDTYAPVVPAIVRFRDARAPDVDLVQPVAAGPRRGVVGLAANASDNAGVTRVEFRLRGIPVGSDDTAPYAVALDTASVPDGGASVEAVAFDAAGNATSRARTITIDNTAPALAVVGPADQTLAPGARAAWTLGVSDASGVSRVECAIAAKGAAPAFGPCSGGSASHSTQVESPGAYSFLARATDAAGNVTTSRPLAFTVAAAAAPTVSQPPGGAPAFLPIVRSGYRSRGALTRFVALTVSNLPAGSRAELTCRGGGCTFKRRRFSERNGSVGLLRALAGRPLRPGARLVIRTVGPRGDVKVVRFTMRRGRLPLKSVRCAPAGGRLGPCA